MAKRIPLVYVAGEAVEQPANDALDVNNGVVTAEDSTEERPLNERFADIVNVMDFGAKGDGETDDTQAFKAAWAKAAQKGGVVYVPHGTYKLTEPVTGEFISFGHPEFTGTGSIDVTDLYDDYVHLTKNVSESVTGTKTFVSFPLVPTPAATDSSTKSANTAWVKSLFDAANGLAVQDDGKIKVSFTRMSAEEIEALVRSLIGDDANDGFDIDDDGKLVINVNELIAGGSNDGFSVTSAGKLKVNPSEFAGNGLVYDSSTGKLNIDFNDPDLDVDKIREIFEPALNALEIPITLKEKTKTFYVNGATRNGVVGGATTMSVTTQNGTTTKTVAAGIDPDTSDFSNFKYTVGDKSYYWGEDLDHPWKTIQACVDFITKYFNLGTCQVYIRLIGGTYEITNEIKLGNYSSSTGSIAIYPYVIDSTKDVSRYTESNGERFANVILNMETPNNRIFYAQNNSTWTVGYMKLVRNFTATTGSSRVYAGIAEAVDGASLTLAGCSLNYSVNTDNNATGTTIIYILVAFSNATIRLTDGTSFDSGSLGSGVIPNDVLNILEVQTGGNIILAGNASNDLAIFPVAANLKFKKFLRISGDSSFRTSTSASAIYHPYFIVKNTTSNNVNYIAPVTNETESQRYDIGAASLVSVPTGTPNAYSSVSITEDTFFPGGADGTISNPSGLTYLSRLAARVAALENA